MARRTDSSEENEVESATGARVYVLSSGSAEWRFQCDGAYLRVAWQSGANRRTDLHPLRELLPEFGEATGRQPETGAWLNRSGVLLGSAIVVALSDLQEHMPLLAPFLGVLSFATAAPALRAVGVTRWTVVNRRDGGQAVYIPHDRFGAEARLGFEKHLASEILQAS